MKAIYDNNIIDIDLFNPGYDNRAFQYGDGLFETILYRNYRIQLLDDHYDRIREGTEMLSLLLPDYFDCRYLENRIHELIRGNQFPGAVRIKVLIWRRTGGLYEPTHHDTHHLILVNPMKDIITGEIRRVGFSKKVVNYPLPCSAFKTQSSLPYVLAGIEKKDNYLDDIILLDIHGNISELLYSNIGWIRHDKFYTPSLDTGCIRGVMRTHLIRKLEYLENPVEEVMAGKKALLEADYVFSANVNGLRAITGIEDRRYPPYPSLEQLLP
jgi:branched-chain amino acid aminotransferase/4-amino-4-deoxychorismate lyase